MDLFYFLFRKTGQKPRPKDLLVVVPLLVFLLIISPIQESFFTILDQASNQVTNQFLKDNILWVIFGGFFICIYLVDSLFLRNHIDWEKLIKAYEYKGKKKSLDLFINQIELNGFRNELSGKFSLDDKGIYLIDSAKLGLRSVSLFLPWNVISVKIDTWRNMFLWFPFGSENEVIQVKTKYEPSLELRIKKGELKIDFERAFYSKAEKY